ncbi:MAG: NADH-quinone oxidoreductase subunit K [Phycisphaeraceae bacterium]|nr:NADH-quinone oxidoreductase subunit K [Phycisphaeraceae bacterium]MBX3407192.1 NADH-quinone oxidoreductase subunit K [Phycisphaeraceae bacterium]
MELVIALTLGLIFGVGVHQMLRRNVIRSAMGLVLVSNAVNLFLIHCGAYRGITPPYTTIEGQSSDPLPQALVLTAIVIGMGGFSFVLAMLYVFALRDRTGDMANVSQLKH